VTSPLVSVVMAVRNAAPYLRASLDSLLAQSLHDIEIIVVDDASTDDSRSIVAACPDPRVVVLCNDRQVGLASSLNRGLACARADLVARQDADDVSQSERLERQLRVMRTSPGLALLGSRGHVIDAGGRRVRRLERPLGVHAIRWYQMFDNAFVHSAVMFRRAVIDDLGGYDASFAWAQDWDLWSRVLRRHAAENLPDRLIAYRLHSHSVTVSGRDPLENRRYVHRIVASTVETTVGITLTAPEVQTLAGFSLGLDRSAIDAWMALVERLARAFRARYPDAAAADEPSRTLSGQIDALAARAQPRTRRTVLAIALAAIRRRTTSRRHLPLVRIGGRLAFGPNGPEAWRRRQAGGSFAP
jgi:GT2 family glycosyltransferase